jgi:phenylalanyl-tRNA synthetase alpha chain
MDNLLVTIDTYKKEINNFIAQKSEEAEAFRIKYLGSKGLVKEVMGEMKNVAADKK